MQFSRTMVLVACGVAMGLLYGVMRTRLNDAYARVSTLEQEVSQQEDEVLGYTQYTNYLTIGKQSLAEQIKLLAATVVRQESVTQVIEKSVLGISSTGTVVIFYTVEYAFGFDLDAERYDITATDVGIQIRVQKPQLVTTPAVSNLKYQILAGGLFTDEEGAVLRLYAEASTQAKALGAAMAADTAIVALCEKRLVAFLHDFLMRQPGVKWVPQITVVYS